MRPQVDRSAIVRLFDSIRDAIPHLSMRLDEKPSEVDLSLDIPEQRTAERHGGGGTNIGSGR